MNGLIDLMLSKRDDGKIGILSSFFKTGKGQYGEGDMFLGINVPITRKIVKDIWRSTSIEDVEEALKSEFHEIRLAALLTLIQIYKHSEDKSKYVDFYLSHTEYINNWDLVDLSCYEILGNWLLTNPRDILYNLAENGKTIWEQRIGIVSTMAFIRNGELDDCYNIADIFLKKQKPLHDLLQKAVGWLLREAGKRDKKRLMAWLDSRYKSMPRTMLRYSIEKFPDDIRRQYLNK